MESEFIDEIKEPEKKNSKVGRNVFISVSGIMLVCLIIFFGFGSLGGGLAYLIGLGIAVIAFSVLSFLTGIGFLAASKKKEGGIMLIIGFVATLFGFVVCGGVLR